MNDNIKIIEYENKLDDKVNEKVSETEYKLGMRYLKIKILGNDEKIYVDESKNRKLCNIIESDLLDLDLDQEELNNGYKYLKIYLPHQEFSKGWMSYSEKDSGWEVYSKKKVKNKKHKKNNLMSEIKKYILVN